MGPVGIVEDRGFAPDDPTCAAPAHFALDAGTMAAGVADPRLAVRQAFALREQGWSGISGQ